MWILHGLDARTTFSIVTLSFAAAVKLVEEFRRSADGPTTFVIDQIVDMRGTPDPGHPNRADLGSS